MTSTGFTAIFNGVYYCVSPYVAGNTSFDASVLSTTESVIGFNPVTVMPAATSLIEIPALVKNYTATDDLFQKAFSHGKDGFQKGMNDHLPPTIRCSYTPKRSTINMCKIRTGKLATRH
jgi:hypothetical protein